MVCGQTTTEITLPVAARFSQAILACWPVRHDHDGEKVSMSPARGGPILELSTSFAIHEIHLRGMSKAINWPAYKGLGGRSEVVLGIKTSRHH